MGGSVMPAEPGLAARPSHPMGPAFQVGGLLPEGIILLVAIERNNTLVTRSDTADDLEELKRLVATLDVPSTSVLLRVVATIEVVERLGRKTASRVEASGRADADSERRFHLRLRNERPVSAARTALPSGERHDVDVGVHVQAGGQVTLEIDWFCDVTWRAKGAAPVRTHTTCRTTATARSGATVVVATQTVAAPAGLVVLRLEITPVVGEAQTHAPGL